MRPRVLVTGGAGFIGSHVTEAYLREGADVCVLDDLSSGSLDNLASVWSNDRLEVEIGDIRDATLMERLAERCDLIVHLAARIGLKLVIESPLRTLEVNAGGTESVLRAAKRWKRKVIVASTSEVYGLSTQIPSREEYPITIGSPLKTRWSYAISKAYDEFLAMAHARELGVPATIVRLFNTVGPRQSARYGMVIPRFITQALAGEPLTVYGDGSQTRCFCHVRDVVRGLMTLANETRAESDVFNLGNPQEISILDLARLVIARTGSSSQISFVPFDVAYEAHFEEIMRRVPDISKIHNLTGFRPAATLEDVLSEAIEERIAKVSAVVA